MGAKSKSTGKIGITVNLPQMLEKIKSNQYQIAYVSFVVVVVATLFAIPQLWSLAIGPLHMKIEGTYPFLDMHGRLAAMKGYSEGIDVLREPNPYDPLHRVSVKPSWYLWLGHLGIGPHMLIPAGTITVVLYLLLNFIILKPKNWLETLVCSLFTCSPGSLLAIERANDDVVFYILLIGWAYFINFNSTKSYYLSTLFINLIAPAKYYPGSAYLTFLYKPKHLKTVIICFSITIVYLIIYAAAYKEELIYLSKSVPKPTFIYSHGIDLFSNFINIDNKFIAIVVSLIAAALLSTKISSDSFKNINRRAINLFLTSTGVMTFCYILNTNYDYRFIFIIPYLPFVFILIKNSDKFLKSICLAMLSMLTLSMYLEQTIFFIKYNPDLQQVEISTSDAMRNVFIKNILLYIGMICTWSITLKLTISNIKLKNN